MIKKDVLEKIERVVKEFFKKTTFEVKIVVSAFEENSVFIDVETKKPQILIGEKGQTLADLQRLLFTIIKRKIPEFSGYINLDVNRYKKKKTEYLKELANSVADHVALTKREKILPPMQAFERRIIHLELAGRSDVTTESIGKEPERRVVVKPYP